MKYRSSRAERVFGISAFLLRSLLTVVVASILVAQANGYEIDFHDLTVRKVGLLVAEVQPRVATVDVPGVVLKATNGQYAAKLAPGSYTLTVSAPGYRTWQRTVRIDAGKSSAFPMLNLFAESPRLIERRSATIDELRGPLVDPRLTVVGSELWMTTRNGATLVTRYSQPIYSATLVDREHIAVVLRTGLHVIDADGSNDQQLVAGPVTGSRILARNDTELGLVTQVGEVFWYSVR